MQLMGLHDLELLLGITTVIGGILLTAHWLWLRPRLEEVIKKEVTQCRETRACNVDGALNIQLSLIASKIDDLSKDMKETRKEIKQDLGHLRDRMDSHINGHSDGS